MKKKIQDFLFAVAIIATGIFLMFIASILR